MAKQHNGHANYSAVFPRARKQVSDDPKLSKDTIDEADVFSCSNKLGDSLAYRATEVIGITSLPYARLLRLTTFKFH